MRIIERYYLHTFLRTLLVIGLGLTALLTLISSFRSTGVIEYADPGLWDLAYLALLSVPANMVAVLPITVLIACLLTVGHASGALELVAVTAAGGRLRNTFAPLLTTGIMLSIFSFALSEVVVPACTRDSIEHRAELMGIKTRLKVAGGNIWLRTAEGSMARLGFYSNVTDTYGDISIFRAEGGRLTLIISAREARHLREQGTWRLSSLTEYDVESGRVRKHSEMDYPYLPEPSELTGGQNFTSRMGAFELRKYLRKLKAAGFKNTELSIELQSRFASPLVNLIMVLIGVSVASRRSLGALRAGAVGVMLTTLYWLMMTMCNALGLAGIVPHVAAAWLSPAIFSAVALRLYLTIPE
jgi:lipopolysaccharide export system permease protein